MDRDQLRTLLDDLAAGRVTREQAEAKLAIADVADLGFASVDHHRALRDGLPEVILAMGKSPAQAATIAAEVFSRAPRVLVTRATPEHADAVLAALPAAVYDNVARLVWCDPQPLPRVGEIAIVCAGTGDLPVAREAAITAGLMGAHVVCYVDVGVAGLHRLTPHIEAIRRANAVVVVAGMEGALASVVGGLVANPVIAVPTSIGYGASFGGLAALLAMLNSCATGVAVVNIDNGFGAGFMAATINRLAVAGSGHDR